MINILYVEDDPGSRDVVRMAQRIYPGEFELTIFDDSENFEQRLLDLDPQPQLILLDIHVEPFTGFQMLEFIGRHDQYDKIPVVALTASVMNEEVQMLEEVGFHSVVSKPLDLDEFPQHIQKIAKGEKIWHVW